MKKNENNKIAIGTAQFSNNYGITNQEFLSSNDIKHIFQDCVKFKINTLDTAPDYGGVEEKIGKFDLKHFSIITKVSLEKNGKIIDEINFKKIINNSFLSLNVDKVYAILIRNPKNLLQNKKLLNTLLNFKEKNKVLKIGYTLYDVGELEVLYHYFKPDIVQIPYSIIDKRFEKQNWINKMYNDGVEIHVRSVFLQGILLTSFKDLPKGFIQHEPFFKKFDLWAKKNKISKLQACLIGVLSDKRIAKVVIGINSRQNLAEINSIKNRELTYPEWLKLTNDMLLDPSKWKR